MKNFLKIVLEIAVIAGMIFGVAALKKEKTVEPEEEIIRPVRTIILSGGSGTGTRRYFGTLQGGRRVDLSFRVSGPIKKILVDKGVSVKKGDLLAALDQRDFQTQLRQAQSAQAQAQAQYNDAQTNFKRYENLYKQRAVSRAQYDSSKTQVDVTRSALNAAASHTVAVRDSLNDTELRAPFDGIIADRKVENFQDITAKQPIFSLQDISTLEVVFNVPERDVIHGRSPDPVSILARFDAIPDQVFPLELKEFETQADTSTNTFPMTAVMPRQKGLNLLPGMAAMVEVDFSSGEGVSDSVFRVPSMAVANDDAPFVWRYENGQVRRIPVTMGKPRNDGTLEISGTDLHGGDNIVIAGVHLLREGQKVRLLKW